MLNPESAFSIAGTIALPCWIALAASLFIPDMREWTWRITGLAVPALIAIAYALLIADGFGADTGGNFGSIAGVRAFFSNDSALAAGWLHYLAFDLFVGTWIARTAVTDRIWGLLVIPCLFMTLMLGPMGLLLFLILRLAFARRAKATA